MNYNEQIKQFWQEDIQHQFTDKEIALYFYLLHTSSVRKDKKTFGISNKTLLAKFGWGRQALKHTKNKLKEANLIDYTPGQGRGNTDHYQIIQKKVRKLKNTIQDDKKQIDIPLQLPFYSDTFIRLWNKLLQAPKWREKPTHILQANLDKLKSYHETFAIQLVEQTLLGNWQGLIFRDTDNQYKKWKAEQHQMNETNQHRRDEIIRRAAQAVATCRN